MCFCKTKLKKSRNPCILTVCTIPNRIYPQITFAELPAMWENLYPIQFQDEVHHTLWLMFWIPYPTCIIQLLLPVRCSLSTLLSDCHILLCISAWKAIVVLNWRSWLRHCATSRKVAGSISDVVGIFHWHNPSGHTMPLGLTQPPTEISTRNISWE